MLNSASKVTGTPFAEKPDADCMTEALADDATRQSMTTVETVSVDVNRMAFFFPENMVFFPLKNTERARQGRTLSPQTSFLPQAEAID
jgi:hypothetical protein